MADYLADKYFPLRGLEGTKMISKQEALQPTLMEEAARDKEMTRRTELPRLAEDTVANIVQEAVETTGYDAQADTERALRILQEGLGLAEPPEVIRPVGELAEKYVAIKKMIEGLQAQIVNASEEANKTADQLERHYGMRVPKLTTAAQHEMSSVTELPQSEDGRPFVAPVQTTVAQIRADSAMGGGDENSFQNSVAASLQSALRALK